MTLKLIWLSTWFTLIFWFGLCSSESKPNIVIILLDDLGFNDVSFHGSNQILTPNIDALAYDGIILNNFYVPPLCTPSRSALLTGKYPINTGMQHFVIPAEEPWGLPLEEKLLPEILAENGYSTNLVGKWHLGFHKKSYTPTMRGFNQHIGYLGPYIDYYNYIHKISDEPYFSGYDMRCNHSTCFTKEPIYATDLFTRQAVKIIKNHNPEIPLFLLISHLAPHAANPDDPLQAPEDEINKHSHIRDPKRRTYAAMVSKIDESLGKVVQALADTDRLNNTIILFFSDNGAPTFGMHANRGSNYPFRGQKNSPWEGGIRSAGFIWSPLLQKTQRISKQLIHSSDWLPTLASAAGISLTKNLNLDGIDMWDALSNGNISPRTNLLHNIDPIIGYSAYMKDDWKYINGTTTNNNYGIWLGETENEVNPSSYNFSILTGQVSYILQNHLSRPLRSEKLIELRRKAIISCSSYQRNLKYSSQFQCDPLKEACLFNIKEDPCEEINLASIYPDIVSSMKKDVETFLKKSKPSRRVPEDLKSNPALYQYKWTWWLDNPNDDNKIQILDD